MNENISNVFDSFCSIAKSLRLPLPSSFFTKCEQLILYFYILFLFFFIFKKQKKKVSLQNEPSKLLKTWVEQFLSKSKNENKYIAYVFDSFCSYNIILLYRCGFLGLNSERLHVPISFGTIFSRWKYRPRHRVPRKSNDHSQCFHLCFEMMLRANSLTPLF